MSDHFVAPLELKFASDGAGEFDGYGAIFGNVDGHGDMIVPGAFTATIAQHKAKGTMPLMYVQHGPALGGDPLPAGVWHDVQEDERGLKVKGKISALDTDYGRRIRGLMQDGAMKGLSIGYRVPTGGATLGRKAGEAKRTLKSLDLIEISIVKQGSNTDAVISGVKADPDMSKAARSVEAAMRLHDRSMAADSYSYASPRDKAQLMNHLRDAYEALTGSRAPDDLVGWKEIPTIRDVERMLREEFGLSRSQAQRIAEQGLKAYPARDEDGDQANDTGTKAAVDELAAGLKSFSLPSFT